MNDVSTFLTTNESYLNTLKNLDFLKKTQNSKKQFGLANKNLENKNNNSTNNPVVSSKTVLAQKGQNVYIAQMDLNDDGKITLDEFNQYCEENGISAKDKITLLAAMQVSQLNSEVAEKALKEDEEKSIAEKLQDKNIYARKGDDKYNEKMDSNNNGIITYAEYYKYMNEDSENDDIHESSATDKFSDLENEASADEEILNPEIQSIVEFEV